MTPKHILAAVLIVSVVGVALYDVVAAYIFGEHTPISNFIHRFVPGAPMIALAVGAWVRHLFGSFPKAVPPVQPAQPGAIKRLFGFLSKIRIHSPVSVKPTLPSGRGIPPGNNPGRGSMSTANPTITAKATTVSQATGITGLSGIIAVIEQLFQAFLSCGTPTAAAVHASITSPNRRQERSLKAQVRRTFRRSPAAVQQMVVEGIMEVGAASTIAETSAMFQESNPGHPPLA